MDTAIPISAKCLTYGRISLLEESLYSFIAQKYSGKYELLIVNDYPLQTLHFDHPKVRIINLKETFKKIGEKEDYSISQCKYDTVVQWDDDDIAQPWHLKNINKFFPGHGLLHWRRGIFMMGPNIKAIRCVGNSGIVFSKQAWQKVGGYPHGDAGSDMDFVISIKKAKEKVSHADPKMPSWIYRWGNNSYHLSGLGRDREDRDNIIVRHSRHIETLRKQGKIPTGDIELKPKWKQDYVHLLKDFINKYHWVNT